MYEHIFFINHCIFKCWSLILWIHILYVLSFSYNYLWIDYDFIVNLINTCVLFIRFFLIHLLLRLMIMFIWMDNLFLTLGLQTILECRCNMWIRGVRSKSIAIVIVIRYMRSIEHEVMLLIKEQQTTETFSKHFMMWWLIMNNEL